MTSRYRVDMEEKNKAQAFSPPSGMNDGRWLSASSRTDALDDACERRGRLHRRRPCTFVIDMAINWGLGLIER